MILALEVHCYLRKLTLGKEKTLKIQFSIIAEDRIFLRMKVLEKDYILKLIFDLNKIQ